MAWRRLMFAIDSSSSVDRAVVRKVAHLAQRLGAEVHVFNCVLRFGITNEQEVHEVIERRREEVDQIAGALREAGVRAKASVRWDYPPRDGIIREAKRFKPDLLVIQARRHSRLARLVLTYTDFKLIETCACPLLVIKNDRPYADFRVIAAVDPMHAHDKPAALDVQIVDAARAVASAMGAELHVYHVCSPWPNISQRHGALRDLPEAVFADVCGASYEARAEARVRELARAVEAPVPQVHIATGDPAQSLSEFVRPDSGDMLVMGAVSRSRLRKALIGYTAERVLDSTDCDVLVVKPAPPYRK